MIEKNASIRCNTCSTNITANYSTIVRIRDEARSQWWERVQKHSNLILRPSTPDPYMHLNGSSITIFLTNWNQYTTSTGNPSCTVYGIHVTYKQILLHTSSLFYVTIYLVYNWDWLSCLRKRVLRLLILSLLIKRLRVGTGGA